MPLLFNQHYKSFLLFHPCTPYIDSANKVLAQSTCFLFSLRGSANTSMICISQIICPQKQKVLKLEKNLPQQDRDKACKHDSYGPSY